MSVYMVTPRHQYAHVCLCTQAIRTSDFWKLSQSWCFQNNRLIVPHWSGDSLQVEDTEHILLREATELCEPQGL